VTPGENIQRWGWWVDPETGKPAIVKSAHGDYVLASEHEARIAELESEIAEAFRRSGAPGNSGRVDKCSPKAGAVGGRAGARELPARSGGSQVGMEGIVVYGTGTGFHTEAYIGGTRTIGHGDAQINEGYLDMFYPRRYFIYN
jgi:hypothetical protein